MANSNVLQVIYTYDAEGNLCFSCYAIGDPAASALQALPNCQQALQNGSPALLVNQALPSDAEL